MITQIPLAAVAKITTKLNKITPMVFPALALPNYKISKMNTSK